MRDEGQQNHWRGMKCPIFFLLLPQRQDEGCAREELARARCESPEMPRNETGRPPSRRFLGRAAFSRSSGRLSSLAAIVLSLPSVRALFFFSLSFAVLTSGLALFPLLAARRRGRVQFLGGA